MTENQKKVLLSIENLEVKFRVRSRILTAIRGISLDVYENESIAIVGESGSGKSVFTKTFAGMLDSNGFIDKGKIIFNDEELADTRVKKSRVVDSAVKSIKKRLDNYSKLEFGSQTYLAILNLKNLKKQKETIDAGEKEKYDTKINDYLYKRTELFNHKQTLDPKHEKEKINEVNGKIADYDKKIEALKNEVKAKIDQKRKEATLDLKFKAEYLERSTKLKEQYLKDISAEISDETKQRNDIIAKEIYLSVGRYGFFKRQQLIFKLLKSFKSAMKGGMDLYDEETRNSVFDSVVFRVRYVDETPEELRGVCVINLANIKYSKDWGQIRGAKIATVFQDPMTSLNPIITIGKQLSSIIIKHQKCSEIEARKRAVDLMKKVGIPNAENRFDDYPFQYSGGMRQRIVIAIALSCQPKILICDEPTTALDVTIQAQILKLIK
ncbi:MAG: ATP-binding cassette domain-containing protein, partial [Clostridia bacterium]|nr:ATP-binding cassette domain-containing protein [Clostridia bacterium]